MQVGIIGLPNAGKSTLFNALTLAHAPVASYPFTTVDPNVGIAEVPDERLHKIAQITHPEKIVPAAIKFLDVAGLVRGASKGEGLGNQFLSQIRGVDALIHVVRCFKNEGIPHVDGEIHPLYDIETINIELILADLEVLNRRIVKIEKKAQAGEKEYKEELAVLLKVKEELDKGIPLRSIDLKEEERGKLISIDLLTLKPLIYVLNVSEDEIGKEETLYREVLERAKRERASSVVVSAKLEAELAELSEEERKDFIKEMGLGESRLPQVIKVSSDLLNLISFFTTESDECRAWLIPKGTKAAQAAGKIHSDMEKGFIKAEVVHYKDLIEAGSFHAARESGHFLIEGREYVVQDGDIITFKFSV